MHEIQERGKKKDERISLTDGDKEDPCELIAPLRELKLKAAIRHAWARTIHTYQVGGQWYITYFAKYAELKSKKKTKTKNKTKHV